MTAGSAYSAAAAWAAMVDGTGMFLLRHTGNDKDFLTTRVSHIFDLDGPSLSVQTACSTSLVATHYACQSLLNGECDMALAGGVTIELPQGHGYLYKENEILSPDGQCHAFDHRAQGTVFGSGAGVVVLRRLSDALADGDHIWAVIKGSAVNNDGAAKAGYLAPRRSRDRPRRLPKRTQWPGSRQTVLTTSNATEPAPISGTRSKWPR